MTAFDDIATQAKSWPLVEGSWADLPADCKSLAVMSQSVDSLAPLCEFKQLKFVWIWPVRARDIEILARLDKLRVLFLCDVRAESLRPLERLTKLEVVNLRSAPKLASLVGFEHFAKLRSLSLYDIPKVGSLQPLAGLSKLTELSVRSSWGGCKDLQFDSLEPLGHLRNLEFLELTGVVPLDQTLAPLGGLRKLKELQITYSMPINEYARLAASLDYLDADCLRPVIELDAHEQGFTCKKCSSKKVILVGKTSNRSKMLGCPNCDRTVIEKRIRIFKDYAEEQRHSG